MLNFFAREYPVAPALFVEGVLTFIYFSFINGRERQTDIQTEILMI